MESKQRKLNATVCSTKMDKTAVVCIERTVVHFTGKYCKTSRKYKVHDENNVLNIGDQIVIAEVKPISKDKSWTLLSVLSHATGVEYDSDANRNASCR